ncbi:MAG TPA: M14 family zinc carboxypeptidase [Blastocatellia bacterium]|nr:M14 family zinc carboxypeptidase [Blastocatellia bacterium]
MAIPDRTNPTDYHYHVYDYEDSAPFSLSDAAGIQQLQFYSLVKDLNQLDLEAKDKNITSKLFSLYPYTAENREIYVLCFGGNSKRRVLFTGGIHGRERIAVEIPYLIAEYLIKNYPHPNAKQPPSAKQIVIKRLVDNRQIFVAPMLNPDGHKHATFDDRTWRINRRILTKANDFTEKNEFVPALQGNLLYRARQYKIPSELKYILTENRREIRFHPDDVSPGVDLNRNFPGLKWGYETYGTEVNNQGEKKTFLATSGDPRNNKAHEAYFGPSTNSENETRAIMHFFTQFGPFLASIDYHSYSKMVLYPEVAKNDGDVIRMAQCLRELIGNGALDSYKCGRPSDLLYPGFSTLMDYSYQSAPNGPLARKPYAFTVELDPEYGNEAVGFDLPEDEILTTFQKNIRGALALIACAGKYLVRVGTPQCCGQFANWNVFNHGNILPD